MADNSGDSVVAFLLGGIFGAAAGILLAPCKGEETRKLVAEWLEESREKTRRFLDDERGSLKNKKERIEAAWHAGKKAYQENGPNEG